MKTLSAIEHGKILSHLLMGNKKQICEILEIPYGNENELEWAEMFMKAVHDVVYKNNVLQ